MTNNKQIYVINEDGIRVDATILSKFRLANNNEYITYTYNEINDEQMIKIYVTGVVNEGGVLSYREITTEEEWNDIKTVLKTLAKSADEPFPESIKSNNKYVGEEISIRKPKKLLVSTKFADVLESKYKEEQEVKVEEPVKMPTPEPVKPVIEKHEELEKTIKIPTFEELQARNKSIQAAMEVAKEEPVKMPAPEPVKPVTPIPTPAPVKEPVYESRVRKLDYEEQFKKDVEPVLLDVYAKQQKHIEELEEELSKTKFDLFEKQKEALSLSNEKEEMAKRSQALEEQLSGVQKKMDGILSVLQSNDNN